MELEHRQRDRIGAAADDMRRAFDADNGWSGRLNLFAAPAEPRSSLAAENSCRGGAPQGGRKRQNNLYKSNN